MRTVIKNRLVGLFLVVFFLFAAIGTILHYPNVLKPLLEGWVKVHYQRALTINGDIQLSLHPNLEIELGPLTLSEYQQDTTFLAIGNSHISLSLSPLLHKKLVAHTLSITGLKIKLIRYQDGRTNFSDLIASEDSDAPANFSLNQVRITDTTLQYDDHANNQSISLTQLNIAIDQATLYSFERAILATQGQIKTYKPTPQQHQLAVKINAIQGHFKTEHLNSQKIDLSLKINNSIQQISGKLSMSGITYAENQYKSTLIADLSFKDMTQTVLINLETSLIGHLENRTLVLPDLATHLIHTKTAYPELSIQSDISGHISASALSEQISANLTGKIQDSTFKALLSITDFNKPALSFDVDIDQLNADQFSPPETQTVSDQAIENKKNSEKNIDLSFLRTLNANGRIHIGTLHVDDIQSSDILFEIQSAKDTLLINPQP